VPVPPSAAAGARQRSFWLHLPPGYRAGRMTPLLLAFHGGGGTGPGMQRTSGLSAIADQRGFLVAYPQGLAQDHGKAPPGWDVSGPKDPYADRIDDGLYVSDVLTAIQSGYCVDPARIWAAGFSNGGGMVGYLACVLAGRIAAFAPVEGVFFQIPGGCHPSHPAAILDVHVRTDPTAPYAGVPARGSPDYFALAVPAWLRGWASRDRCARTEQQVAGPARIPTGLWARCPAGVAVAGIVLGSGGHSWFGEIGAPAGDALITGFFARHPLRAAPGGWTPQLRPPAPPLIAPEIRVRSVRVIRLPPGAEPFDIAAGPDGSMWFTEFDADMIGRVSRTGVLTQFRVPTAMAGPYQIAAGPQRTMWFTEYNTTMIGRVSAEGRITEFPLPRPTYGGTGITASAAGHVLVAEPAGYIDSAAAGGAVTRTKVVSRFGFPFAIARLPDGTIWLNELTGYYEYSRHLLGFRPGASGPQILTLPSPDSTVVALAAGPAGSVWFADFGTSMVGEIRAAGRVSQFGLGPVGAGLSDVTAGPDGAMWVSAQDGAIARITTAGAITELALAAGSNPDGIAAGPGRSVWVAETGADAIAEITLDHAR
jgi:polyhydroxybutyrate depolymerase